jgi:uncharacterized protein
MEPFRIIEKYYAPGSLAFSLLIHHSRMVKEKALVIARKVRRMNPDIHFISEAAILHDIGIFHTNEPEIGCFGNKAYICHGYLGREILEQEALPLHALVCERHVGLGLSISDIEEKNLPIPKRDMIPVSLEEQIICYADKFFSKSPEFISKEKPISTIREGIARYGREQIKRFDEWVLLFGI